MHFYFGAVSSVVSLLQRGWFTRVRRRNSVTAIFIADLRENHTSAIPFLTEILAFETRSLGTATALVAWIQFQPPGNIQVADAANPYPFTLPIDVFPTQLEPEDQS